jgi:HEPN domain-containing protein
LKAFLQVNDKHVPKTHNLIELLALCLQIDATLEFLRADLIVMERYAVRVRYPGNSAEKMDAKAAYQAVKVVRQFVRQKLELK